MPSLSVKPFLARSLIIGAISTASILFGLVPNLQHPTSGFTLDFNTAAYAQSISDEEVISYARSVLAIEPFRQAAYEQIKQITGSSNVPQIACHRPSSLNELPSNIRQIAIDYCNQAISIVESNSLTISRFNEITVAHQSDSTLSERIQQIILQLQ
ncbi:MAG: DUF4168 domain-containing protein [Cyanobacteria bacterium CRU_2_1]|nr:DUF4168 domain-containing protein [Cyanobacteria bacterium CRU_2_1]